MYNIVLIGCGHMGEVHLDDIYLNENINIYGVADLDIERAKLFQKKYNAEKCTTNCEELIKDKKTDIVICAAYARTHLDILRLCVKYKKHLLCEKPVTPDLKSAYEFVSLAKNSDIKVQIGFILRFNETYKKVGELIRLGTIGSPLVVRMTQNHHVLKWQKYRSLLEDTSPVVDCGVHYIDLLKEYTNAKVVSVSGISQTLDEETPKSTYNYGLITVKMSDGSVAFYESGWGGSIASENKKEFIGPKGRITITERENRTDCKEEGDLITLYKKETGEYETINVDCKRRPTMAQLNHLIDMIEKNSPPIPDLDSVLEDMKTLTKADETIKNI